MNENKDLKNICQSCERQGKCFFERNNLVCKKIVEAEKELNQRKQADLAFEKAIWQGRLSENPKAENYAGKYMYMGKSENGQYDNFKNIITRRYDV